MQNHIFSGASEISAAAAITAALAQIVVHVENGETVQVAPVDIAREPTHWRATLRIAIVDNAPGKRPRQPARKVATVVKTVEDRPPPPRPEQDFGDVAVSGAEDAPAPVSAAPEKTG